MKHTSRMKLPASEYFARNIWISADPEERMLPLVVQFAWGRVVRRAFTVQIALAILRLRGLNLLFRPRRISTSPKLSRSSHCGRRRPRI